MEEQEITESMELSTLKNNNTNYGSIVVVENNDPRVIIPTTKKFNFNFSRK